MRHNRESLGPFFFLEAAFPDLSLQEVQGRLDERLKYLRDHLTVPTCPLEPTIPSRLRMEKLDPAIGDVPGAPLAVLMRDLDRLPSRTGSQQWYPSQVIATIR
jgi:hypothetical protein